MHEEEEDDDDDGDGDGDGAGRSDWEIERLLGFFFSDLLPMRYTLLYIWSNVFQFISVTVTRGAASPVTYLKSSWVKPDVTSADFVVRIYVFFRIWKVLYIYGIISKFTSIENLLLDTTMQSRWGDEYTGWLDVKTRLLSNIRKSTLFVRKNLTPFIFKPKITQIYF